MIGKRRIFGGVMVLAAAIAACPAQVPAPADKTSGQTAGAEDGAKAGDITDPKRIKLIAETRRMLALSREIQTEMAKNGADTLSLAMVKKVQELQKLAAQVQKEIGKTP